MGNFWGKHRFSLSLTFLNIAIVSLGVFVHTSVLGTSNDSAVEQAKKYPLLSKRIFVDNQNDLIVHFTPLRAVIDEYIDLQQKTDGEIGLYFEYLPSGTSISANDDMNTKIASLVKIPTVMAIYKKVEKGQLSLDKELTIQKDDIDPMYGDLWKKGVGYKLSVREAIDLTLVKSDNTAQALLINLLDDQSVAEVLQELNIPLTETGQYFIISPKNYTSILRSLYLSSYLKREDSNKILEILTKTDFHDKLEAGVPDHTPVAHKIGVYNENAGTAEDSYSDCGIVYVPNRPYALCIMIRGNDENLARQHMKNLSQLIYSYVTNVN